MNLEQLKNQARMILSIEPVGGFEHKTFSVRSGGSPRNKIGIPEVHREDVFAYDTVCNGGAYRGSVTVECRDTGAKDADGDTINITPSGVVFVYHYRQGSPDRFDRGSFLEPNMMVTSK